ncbi:hypothetical protein [Cellulomonas soli]|uniref:Uncharacterized protein n=1 Tax=Cellulomonas soli TaxID=931535 RepID=A0A512PEL9_9CELL|nr:hypothetical protein [Cellulomonas soli]NYI58880.1 hypothetical protein [Cellulomonas soli]GEP69626.1 hypothetical protein CSO01_23410 [Cellulomonas soli]
MLSDAPDWFAWILLLVLLAGAVLVISGGVVRSVSQVPSDATMRRVSAATWWVSPGLVTVAGACTVWAVRAEPGLAAGVAVLTVGGAMLGWRWRPSRADRVRLPRVMVRARAAVPVPIRDAAAWHRQMVQLVTGGVLLVVAASVLR